MAEQLVDQTGHGEDSFDTRRAPHWSSTGAPHQLPVSHGSVRYEAVHLAPRRDGVAHPQTGLAEQPLSLRLPRADPGRNTESLRRELRRGKGYHTGALLSQHAGLPEARLPPAGSLASPRGCHGYLTRISKGSASTSPSSRRLFNPKVSGTGDASSGSYPGICSRREEVKAAEKRIHSLPAPELDITGS